VRIVVLSTQTKHHTYFINKLAEKFDVVGVIYETRRLSKDYVTGPFLEEEMGAFEERFFHDVSRDLSVPSLCVNNINHHPGLLTVDNLGKEFTPDLAISFGTGLLKEEIFIIPKYGTINIHRGLASEYRGLDSEFWAIYNHKLEDIGVTLHYVDPSLDTGDILAEQRLISDYDISDMKIYELRYWTTLLATDMILNLLGRFSGEKIVQGKKQKNVGKYYSSMPLSLKCGLEDIFEKWKWSSEIHNTFNSPQWAKL